MAIKPKQKSPAADSSNAIAILKADHKKVKGLFEEFNRLCDADGTSEEKGEVAAQICRELTIHSQTEEDIFYPALRDAGVEESVMNEADVEHAGAKDLIAQISAMQPDEPLYDAKVTVLGEYIDHHVKEEEGEMFPKARTAGVDMDALGGEIEVHKSELMDRYDAEDGNGRGNRKGRDDGATESEDDDSAGKVPAGVGKPRSGSKKSNSVGVKSR